MDDKEILESVIGFDALYESMYKCKRNVSWKDSVAHYFLNGVEQTIKLEERLKDGSYKPRPVKKFTITHPKKREAVSIAYIDRVYQRSLNDNVLYPAMTKSFIEDNLACQKGKGTDKARDRLDHFLRSYYMHYGCEGNVLQCDIHGYYPNMDHDVAEERFRMKTPDAIYQRTKAVLRGQYEGEVGYNPGSQMIQIAGISILDPMDHMIKEKLHIKYYLRYMDDFILIHPDKDYLEHCRKEIDEFLAQMKFELHPSKTRIYEITDGIKFLGFTHKLTKTGKVIRLIDSKNVKMERKKLRRMVQLAKKGVLTKEKVDSCFDAWIAHASKGNSTKLICRMRSYYKSLWRKESWF